VASGCLRTGGSDDLEQVDQIADKKWWVNVSLRIRIKYGNRNKKLYYFSMDLNSVQMTILWLANYGLKK